MAVEQALRESASLPVTLRELKKSHLRATLCAENALELFDTQPEFAKAYLELAVEESEILDLIERELHRRNSE